MGRQRMELLKGRKKLKKNNETIEINQQETGKNNEKIPLGILSLPVELLLQILTYLDPQDLHTLRDVSQYFSMLVREPSVWRVYEVNWQHFFFFLILKIHQHINTKFQL